MMLLNPLKIYLRVKILFLPQMMIEKVKQLLALRKGRNVDFNSLNRIKYREISKKAIQNALKILQKLI